MIYTLLQNGCFTQLHVLHFSVPHTAHVRFGRTFLPYSIHHPVLWDIELGVVDSLIFRQPAIIPEQPTIFVGTGNGESTRFICCTFLDRRWPSVPSDGTAVRFKDVVDVAKLEAEPPAFFISVAHLGGPVSTYALCIMLAYTKKTQEC